MLRRPATVALAAAALVLVAAPSASAAGKIKLRTVQVLSPGNPSVAINPFTDAAYESCAEADPTKPCMTVGSVAYPYEIGQFEVNVKQYVTFLNTADPTGRDPHDLYDESQSSAEWPKYGQIDMNPAAPRGKRYSVAYPEWKHKPYGFANFLRAARFANSVYNGNVKVIAEAPAMAMGNLYQTHGGSISPKTETGMYDMRRRKSTRTSANGFVIPSQDEWIKAAYFDPASTNAIPYWKYPTNAGVFGDTYATAPGVTTLSKIGNVTNAAATQPLANYKGATTPSWCPPEVKPRKDCNDVNPMGIRPPVYRKLYQGSLSTIGQARTLSPWGTLDQGGNAVEWTDTITPPPAGKKGARVWRRLHGGIPNAPGYQLWLSAVGLQPQDNKFYDLTYPWLGFRIGVIGSP
jgi:formylglycine-generating enzyme required for sulfatase activity